MYFYVAIRSVNVVVVGQKKSETNITSEQIFHTDTKNVVDVSPNVSRQLVEEKTIL